MDVLRGPVLLRTKSYTMTWLLVLLATLSVGASGNTGFSRPTRVPGSLHLVTETDFPYEFWQVSSQHHTPAPPPPSHYSEHTNYGFYYGEANANLENDPSTWQVMPIQIPNDLVGDVKRKMPRTTTKTPQTYPTSATPQYGRHPGVTERPHLFHPERLHNKRFRNSTSRRPQVDWHEEPETQSSWHQTFMDQLKPLLPSLPRFPTLPKISSITRSPPKSSWSASGVPENAHLSQADTEAQKSDTAEPGQNIVHRFYPLSHPSLPPGKKRQKIKRPGYGSPAQDGYHHPDVHHTPLPPDQNYDNYYHLPRDNHNYPEAFSPDNRFVHFPEASRPTKNQRHPSRNQNRPLRRFQGSHNQRPGMEENQYYYEEQQSPVDQQRPGTTHRQPTRGQQNLLWGQSNPRRPYQHQNEEQNWHFSEPDHLAHIRNQPQKNKFHPVRHRNRPYQSLPHRQGNLDHDEAYKEEHEQSQSSYYNSQFEEDNHPQTSDNWASQRPGSSYLDSSYSSHEITDRWTEVDTLSAVFAVPGTLLVIGLALAVFYFNFMWQPTTVVTAKLVKLLADSSSDSSISEEQQKAIGEVYEVFRSLETEYVQDHSLWTPACKSRLVCQVHKELPGLWRVTEAYAALVRSRLATGPAGDEDFTIYLEAAWRGTRGSPCLSHYTSCRVVPVPVEEALYRLSDSLQNLHYS